MFLLYYIGCLTNADCDGNSATPSCDPADNTCKGIFLIFY